MDIGYSVLPYHVGFLHDQAPLVYIGFLHTKINSYTARATLLSQTLFNYGRPPAHETTPRRYRGNSGHISPIEYIGFMGEFTRVG